MNKKVLSYVLSLSLLLSIALSPTGYSYGATIEAVEDNIKITQGKQVTISPLANDISGSGGTMTILQLKSDPEYGTAVINEGSKTILYTPNADAVAVKDSFIYEMTDGTDTATGVIHVYINSTTKIAYNDTAVVVMNDTDGIEVDVLANDKNFPSGAEPVISAIEVQPKHGTAEITDDGGFIQYIPTTGYIGKDTLTYVISDAAGDAYATAVVNITVRSLNHAPVVLNYSKATNEDTALTIDVLSGAKDADRDTMILSNVTDGTLGSSTIVSKKVVYSPYLNVNGTDTITYTVTDACGASTIGIINIIINPVNDVPVPGDYTIIMSEDSTTSVACSYLASLATDVENDTLSVVTPLTQGKLGTATITNGSIAYISKANVSGTDTIKYTLTDGNGGITKGSISIEIDPMNDPPVAVKDVATTKEDTSVSIPILKNDMDTEKDKLSINRISSQGALGDAIISGNNVIYTPKANKNGTDTFLYEVTDGKNTVEGTVVVNIAPVNDNPVVINDTVSTPEDTQITIYPLANDTDVECSEEGISLTLATFTPGSKGGYVVSGSSIIYTPTANFIGTDTCKYTVWDGEGGSATGMITITVTTVNDPPIALPDTVTTKEHTKVTIDAAKNDKDVDSGDKVSVSKILTQGTLGTATLVSGKIDYVPSGHAFGTDTFTYEASDTFGATASAIITVVIAAVPDPPTAVEDDITTVENQAVTISPLSNDSDPKGNTPLKLAAITKNGSKGTASVGSSNMIVYTPKSYTVGTDEIQYSVLNSIGITATGTIDIIITAENTVPIAKDDTAKTNEDTAVIIDVLKNDKDMDGDTMTINAILDQGSLGTATINSKTKNITYTPDENAYGTDTFEYEIVDTNGGTGSAIVAVTVTEVNDIPITDDDSVNVYQNYAVNIKVLKNDSDADGDDLTVKSVATKPTKGKVTISADKKYVTYTPNLDLTGDDKFEYAVDDGRGGTTNGAVEITIKPYDIKPDELSDIEIDGESIEGFVPDITTYTVKKLSTLTYVDLNITTADEDATYSGPIGYTEVKPGMNTFKWVVTGQNGSEKEYVLNLKLTCPTDIVLDDDEKASYSDTKGHWAEINADGLGGLNIISGYPDGTFKPNQDVTRAEFAKILIKTLELGSASTNKNYKDVNSKDWYYSVVNTASANGLVEGYQDGSFKPDATITRQEMATMVARAIRQINGHEPSLSDVAYINFFDSYEIGDWAKPSVGAAVRYDIVSGKNGEIFDPKSNVKRGEAAKVIDWLYGLERGIVTSN